MKKILFYTVLTMMCVIAFFVGRSMALSFDWENQFDYHSSGPYNWWSSYDIKYEDNMLWVDIDLYARGPGTINQHWEPYIETFWSTDYYKINIDWVQDDYDYMIYISDGVGRADLLTWYETDSWRTVAHEVGHMWGLYDEYPGGAIDPMTGLIDYGGIMGNLNGGLRDRYYASFNTWLNGKTAVLPMSAPSAAPEPLSVLLVGSGLIGIFAFRNRFKRFRCV